MLKLTYKATEFPKGAPPELSGTHTLEFEWSELVWAAISVGRAGFGELFKFGLYSTFEMVYRSALVYANLRETIPGYLTRSAAYRALDPSEKGAISYFLGLTTSKLFAHRCLQVPWLLHLDVYRSQLQAVLQPGRSKPDLVGQDCNGEWIVVESKGRTHELEESALAKAKAQARRVRSISGSSPKYKLGIQAYFESSQLSLSVVDPDENDDDRVDLPITVEMITAEYYQPFRNWIDERDHIKTVKIAGRSYLVRAVPQFDFAVGLDSSLYRGPSTETASNAEEIFEGQPPHDQFTGRDGVLVQLGPTWSSKNMRREPEQRIRAG
jgi:hypothetical protein